MPSTVDGHVGNWTNMIGAEAVAARAARQAAPSVESVRCVEYDQPFGGPVTVTYDGGAFHTFRASSDGNEWRSEFSTLVDLLKRYLPPTDEKLSALHRLRLSATAPVDFGDPQPTAD